jgi:hypothetical protein
MIPEKITLTNPYYMYKMRLKNKRLRVKFIRSCDVMKFSLYAFNALIQQMQCSEL